jgi:GAF domain-containing protein
VIRITLRLVIWGRTERLILRIAALITAAGVIIGAVVVAIKFGLHHSISLWVAYLLVALGAGITAVLVRGGPKSSGDPDLSRRVAQREYEQRLLRDALGSIQLGIAQDEPWDLDDLVQRGVHEPVRGFLVRTHDEDVRLAGLFPREGEPDLWHMRWAAGHRPESVGTYRRGIDQTLAGLAYRRGEIVTSDDVRQDPRFQAHPLETRPFAALVAVPLLIGNRIVGTLSVVSTRPGAFDPQDVSFIETIAALLDLVLADELDVERIERDALAAAQRGEDADEEQPGRA